MAKQRLNFPRRTIHLDFHTGPAVPDVGRNFDAETFARTFQDARVDSVTLFAKCHHGHLYYDTDHPARHPSLPKGLDLLGEQIEALHRVGIQAPIYISVQCDEYAANTHPEWVALKPNLQQVKWGESAFIPGWQILDLSSPYQDYLADQIVDVLKRFAPVDGLFLDMCWDQPSASKWAIDGMKRKGLDPKNEADRSRYARLVAREYMARYNRILEQYQKGHPHHGIWYNSRPKTVLHEEKKFLRHVEIECLPTGGWGYAYFPYVVRFVRPLGLPTLSHTGRFHKCWGDNSALKPKAALKYECCLMLSQGVTCGVGDLLHPRAALHPTTYKLIGDVYRYVESCEPFTDGAKVLSEIGVLIDPEAGENPGPAGQGLIRALQQLRKQFDLLPPSANLKAYPLILVSEMLKVDTALQTKLRAYVRAGGAVVFSGRSAWDEEGKPVLEEQGVVSHGPSPYSHVFLRPERAIQAGIDPFDTVMYEPTVRMTAAKGAQVLCRIVEPYFERSYNRFCGHEYTPPDRLSPFAAVVQKGSVLTFAMPILEAFGKHANVPYRQILGNCLDRLLPQPLLRDAGPVHLEATVMQRGRTRLVHLISFLPSRQAEGLDIVHDPFPLVDMPISVRFDRQPRRATLQPQNQPVAFDYRDGYLHARVTVPDGHAMLVIE